MNARSVMGVFLVLLPLLMTAGCIQTTPPVTPTPAAVVTATEVPTPVPTTVSLTPGPTQTLPEVWDLDIQVQSNGVAIDPLITVSVQGGKGLNFIQQIEVKVTRSDGVAETEVISKPLYKGKEVSLRSTTAPGYRDRAEVWATTPQGEKVKIFDDYIAFRTYH